MKKGDSIFVYGTLRRGERADLSGGFYNYGVDFLDGDKINGKLYHLGAFPGVCSIGHGEFNKKLPAVVGEVFRIQDASIVALLDAYEGYRASEPAHGMYDRHQVQTEMGRKVWVYTYNYPVLSEQQIPSGDWCKNRNTAVSVRQLRA